MSLAPPEGSGPPQSPVSHPAGTCPGILWPLPGSAGSGLKRPRGALAALQEWQGPRQAPPCWRLRRESAPEGASLPGIPEDSPVSPSEPGPRLTAPHGRAEAPWAGSAAHRAAPGAIGAAPGATAPAQEGMGGSAARGGNPGRGWQRVAADGGGCTRDAIPTVPAAAAAMAERAGTAR